MYAYFTTKESDITFIKSTKLNNIPTHKNLKRNYLVLVEYGFLIFNGEQKKTVPYKQIGLNIKKPKLYMFEEDYYKEPKTRKETSIFTFVELCSSKVYYGIISQEVFQLTQIKTSNMYSILFESIVKKLT